MAGWFKSLKGDIETRQIIGFDIEGVGGPGGFVCGAIVGDSIYQFFTDREEMLNMVLAYARDGYVPFAHNLQYDLPILEADQFPIGELLFTKYNLLWCRYKKWGRNVKVFDSGNLFPRHNLAAIGEMVGYPKLELPSLLLLDLAKGKEWSHFTDGEKKLIQEYCLRDAEIVFMAVSQLQEIVNRLGGNLKPTIAGISMDIYRRRYHKWPFPTVGPETNRMIRPAFYGGRTENFVSGQISGVNMYDITSLYPFVQRNVKYPHPGHLKLDLEPGTGREWLKGEGVVKATVTVPEWFIPPLPHRFSKRLFFPFGRITGQWTIYELRYALELGVSLESVDWVIWSKVTFNPFVDFVDEIFGLRQYYLENHSGIANIVKLILNSLYGRWGLEPEGGLFTLAEITPDMDLTELAGFTTHELAGKLYAYGPIENVRPPDYINVFFASQIASAGRIELLYELTKQGEKSVYCDTDSIITRGTIETGEGLGDWRLQMENGTADLIGPKEYALHNAYLGDKYIVKGVPADVAEAYLKTGVARFFRAVNIREAFRNGQPPSTWVETFRSARDVFPKRYPYSAKPQPDGSYQITYPYSARDLPSVCQGYYSLVPELVWSATPKLPAGLRPLQQKLI